MLYDCINIHFTSKTHFVFVTLSFGVEEVFAHFLGEDGDWIVYLKIEKQKKFSINSFVSHI